MNEKVMQSVKNPNDLLDTSELNNINSDNTEIIPNLEEFPENSKKKTKLALERLEMMVMQQTPKGGLDISSLSEQQRDKVLDLMHKNEDNSFSYAKEKLKVTENLNEKALEASIVNQKTLRYCLLGGGSAFFILMVLILFFKDDYFVPFLSFATGLIGGIGLKSAFSQLTKKPNFVNENDE
jgi:hypothetical protein